MNKQELYSELFGEKDPVALDTVIREYPYFTPAHFFRLQNTRQDDPDLSARQSGTALYFGNPMMLRYRLMEDMKKTTAPIEEMTGPGTAVIPGPTAVPESGNDLIFEPLYTTDYFASQGIKLSAEVKENDKLGKQLRSFTDWLKTMKKLPDASSLPNSTIDKAVEVLAEKSNLDEQVLTESMAEVLVAQGKLSKAREIYSKLSLQNPAKSVYFASKIELLKD